MLKSIVLSFLTVCSVLSLTAQRVNQASQINIVPRPVEITTSKGSLDLTKRASFMELTGADVSIAGLLDEFLKTKDLESGRELKAKGFPVKLAISKNDRLGNEGY